MNEEAVATLRALNVSPDLLALLPDDIAFVLKESQGDNDNLPLISATHHTDAAIYVGLRCFWLALDPDVAKRYSTVAGLKIAKGKDNRSTLRVMVHPEEARRPEAREHIRAAVAEAINRSLARHAAQTSDRTSGSRAIPAAICPTHFEAIPVGTGICERCAEG